MPRCNHRPLALLAVFAFLLVAVWGCEQVDDIPVGVTTTNLYLAIERLPSTPSGMIYELWVADNSDTLSLGRFGWDHVNKRVLTVTGAIRPDSNKFQISDDLLQYDDAFVTVEVAGSLSGQPGPIMLIDNITDPHDEPIELVFPLSDSLWDAIVRYNMETTTDDSRGNDAQGVWFSNYTVSTDSTPDTTSLSYTIDSSDVRALLVIDSSGGGYDSIFVTPSQDTLTKAEVFVLDQWDISNIVLDSVLKMYGDDTLNLGANPANAYFSFIRYDIDSMIDSTEPYVRRTFDFTWTTNNETVPLDVFTQDDFNLPNYSSYGWKYKGWVLSTTLDPNVTGTAFYPLAWEVETPSFLYIPGASVGGMLTTGTCSEIDQPDDANPFGLAGGEVPPYPGEDFLDATALQAEYNISSVDLVPGNQVTTVFISLEPDNFPHDSTNFPLVPFIGVAPINPAQLPNGVTIVSITMQNWTQAVNGNIQGFPKITISIERL